MERRKFKLCQKPILSLLILLISKQAFAFKMGAMGDSLTTGYNAHYWRNNRHLSWSTGWDFKMRTYSHYHRLRKIINEPVYAYNAAVEGSRLSDLFSQANKLKGKDLDYLTVMVGANDICRWRENYEEELATFSRDLEQLVTETHSEHPRAKILVAPIFDLVQLYHAGLEKGCAWKWLILPSCTPLTSTPASRESREAFAIRLARTNAVIKAVASSFDDRVRYAASMAALTYTPEHLDHKDCFHPSLAGQNLFATATWQDSWFAEPGFNALPP